MYNNNKGEKKNYQNNNNNKVEKQDNQFVETNARQNIKKELKEILIFLDTVKTEAIAYYQSWSSRRTKENLQSDESVMLNIINKEKKFSKIPWDIPFFLYFKRRIKNKSPYHFFKPSIGLWGAFQFEQRQKKNKDVQIKTINIEKKKNLLVLSPEERRYFLLLKNRYKVLIFSCLKRLFEIKKKKKEIQFVDYSKNDLINFLKFIKIYNLKNKNLLFNLLFGKIGFFNNFGFLIKTIFKKEMTKCLFDIANNFIKNKSKYKKFKLLPNKKKYLYILNKFFQKLITQYIKTEYLQVRKSRLFNLKKKKKKVKITADLYFKIKPKNTTITAVYTKTGNIIFSKTLGMYKFKTKALRRTNKTQKSFITQLLKVLKLKQIKFFNRIYLVNLPTNLDFWQLDVLLSSFFFSDVLLTKTSLIKLFQGPHNGCRPKKEHLKRKIRRKQRTGDFSENRNVQVMSYLKKENTLSYFRVEEHFNLSFEASLFLYETNLEDNKYLYFFNQLRYNRYILIYEKAVYGLLYNFYFHGPKLTKEELVHYFKFLRFFLFNILKYQFFYKNLFTVSMNYFKFKVTNNFLTKYFNDYQLIKNLFFGFIRLQPINQNNYFLINKQKQIFLEFCQIKPSFRIPQRLYKINLVHQDKHIYIKILGNFMDSYPKILKLLKKNYNYIQENKNPLLFNLLEQFYYTDYMKLNFWKKKKKIYGTTS